MSTFEIDQAIVKRNREGMKLWGTCAGTILLAGSHPVWDRTSWRLIPRWAKDPSFGSNLFNARAETIAEKPSFREAFKKNPKITA